MISRRSLFGFLGSAAAVPTAAVIGKEAAVVRGDHGGPLIVQTDGPVTVENCTFTVAGGPQPAFMVRASA